MLHRLIVIIVWLMCAQLTIAQPTIFRPADAPPPREGWRLLNGAWIRPTGGFRFAQIIHARIDDRRLVVGISPDATWKPKLINARRIIAEAEPDRALWWMMFTQTSQLVPADRRGTALVLLPAVDLIGDKDGPLRLAGVTIAPGGTIIRGAGRADGRFVQVEYHADRDGRSPRLTVVTQAGRGLDFSGDDLVDLLHKNPLVVRRFLAPLLNEMTGEALLRPRPADVYRVFPEIEPTAEEVAAFATILKDLNAADADVRDSASKNLEQLRPATVLAAVRSDWSRLSPEQTTRLALFVENNSLGETDAARAQSDIEFLRALESFPDRRVRDLARDSMATFAD